MSYNNTFTTPNKISEERSIAARFQYLVSNIPSDDFKYFLTTFLPVL